MADSRMRHAVRMAANAGRVRVLSGSLARGGALAAATARCGALALMVPVAAAGLAASWDALPAGVVSWDDTADALLAAVRITGPAAAGIAAWTAVSDRRTGLGKLERLAVRPATSRALGRLCAAAATALAGYAATAAVLAGWMIAHGPVAGPVPAAEVLAGAAALLCCATTGFLAGSLVPSSGPPALPALAIAAAAWAVTSLSGPAGPGGVRGPGWWRLLVPPALHHPLFTQWRTGLFGGELAWFAGLACAGTLAFCWTVARRRGYLAAAAIPLALAVTGAAWIHAQRLRPAVPDSPRLSCQTWPLVICVHPALAQALPQLEPAFTTIAAHLAGTPAAVRRLTQEPGGTRYRTPHHGSYVFHLDDLAPGYERALEAGLAAQVVPWCPGRAGEMNEPVRDWLLNTPMPGDVASGMDAAYTLPEAGRGPDAIFRAYTEKQRRQWLRRHYRQVASCRLTLADFRPFPGHHRRQAP